MCSGAAQPSRRRHCHTEERVEERGVLCRLGRMDKPRGPPGLRRELALTEASPHHRREAALVARLFDGWPLGGHSSQFPKHRRRGTGPWAKSRSLPRQSTGHVWGQVGTTAPIKPHSTAHGPPTPSSRQVCRFSPHCAPGGEPLRTKLVRYHTPDPRPCHLCPGPWWQGPPWQGPRWQGP